jgi:hypothetical protein
MAQSVKKVCCYPDETAYVSALKNFMPLKTSMTLIESVKCKCGETDITIFPESVHLEADSLLKVMGRMAKRISEQGRDIGILKANIKALQHKGPE